MTEKRGEIVAYSKEESYIVERERVEKTNHTRCEIENVKVKPPHKKRKEKCTNKICCPVEEQNLSKLPDSCNEELVPTR